MSAIAAEPVTAHRLTLVRFRPGTPTRWPPCWLTRIYRSARRARFPRRWAGSSKPSMYSSVDFPQPLGPDTATVSPRMTSWSTPLTAWTRLESLP
jgi:hypothetical protein